MRAMQMSGARKPSEERPPEPVACDTSRQFHDASRTDSGLVCQKARGVSVRLGFNREEWCMGVRLDDTRADMVMLRIGK